MIRVGLLRTHGLPEVACGYAGDHGCSPALCLAGLATAKDMLDQFMQRVCGMRFLHEAARSVADRVGTAKGTSTID